MVEGSVVTAKFQFHGTEGKALFRIGYRGEFQVVSVSFLFPEANKDCCDKLLARAGELELKELKKTGNGWPQTFGHGIASLEPWNAVVLRCKTQSDENWFLTLDAVESLVKTLTQQISGLEIRNFEFFILPL